jgi:hypothetical protein
MLRMSCGHWATSTKPDTEMTRGSPSPVSWGNPFSLAYALAHAAWLSQFCREGHAVQAQAEELITLTQAHGFPHQAAQGLL